MSVPDARATEIRPAPRALSGGASRPRLLLLTASYPAPGASVPAGYLHELARALSRDWLVDVLAPRGPGLVAVETRDEVRVTRFAYAWPRALERVANGSGIPDNLRAAPWLALQIPPFLGSWASAACARARGSQVIAAHWAVPGGLVGAVASARAHVPFAIVLHSGGVHVLSRMPGGRALARWLGQRASLVIATSSHVASRFLELQSPHARVRNRTHVVPIGVDVPSRPVPLQDRPRMPDRIVFCGRLVPVKGVDVLIRAFGGARGVKIDVVGDGPLRAALEASCAKLGTPAVFHGRVDGARRTELLSRARCIVIPSRVLRGGRSEGMPRVLLEAAAAGTPVVATAVGEMAQGTAWLTVPPEDAAALRSEVDHVLAPFGPGEELARRAHDWARARDWKRIGPMHSALLAGIAT